jgi:SAM-dependent methyltransferase
MDIGSYRLNQRLAKAAIPSWRLMAIHGAHVFRQAGFPLEIDSTDELVNLLDTMHENQFDPFVAELNGLDDGEVATLLDALVDYCRFFRVHFPGAQAPIPLSTMVAHLAIALKLRGLGTARRILEIGPGCGYLSFFLGRWPELASYAQIESAESFYILQNLVNKHVFAHRFRDFAQADWGPAAAAIGRLAAGVSDLELSARLAVDFPAVCSHYPWWRIDDLANQQFDVITSNANFTEFSEGAFRQYVQLIDRCLAPDGCLLIQCLGGGSLDPVLLLRGLVGIRLVPVVATNVKGGVVAAGQWFALPNFLFVRERHPAAQRYARETLALPLYEPDDPFVSGVFARATTGQRRRVGAAEILGALEARLKVS